MAVSVALATGMVACKDITLASCCNNTQPNNQPINYENEIRQLRVDLRAFLSRSAVLGKIQGWTDCTLSGVVAAYVRSGVAI